MAILPILAAECYEWESAGASGESADFYRIHDGSPDILTPGRPSWQDSWNGGC